MRMRYQKCIVNTHIALKSEAKKLKKTGQINRATKQTRWQMQIQLTNKTSAQLRGENTNK